ncbi:MurR/RpiR family transcriptional regulator [Fusobacterium sp.]|uniref:MurR/RpiR family transcriptional regulator n=1 Tax=Fusobacterium sp. TaxID=68766 RepID=UPI002623CB81|nr:MurR/RpiR family transcriptional regulator [Fusobacterium sp.]
MSVIDRINTLQGKFTSKEKKINKFIMANIDRIMYMNTYEIAEQCETSQASVVRFAKKLGYSGFPELKVDFGKEIGRREAKEKISFTYEDMSENGEIFENIKNVVKINTRIIEDTYSSVDVKVIEKTVKAIKKARKIVIVGAGYSGIIARDLEYKLLELGINVIFQNDFHTLLTIIPTLTEEDILFVISQSGRTSDIYYLVEESKKRNIKIIAITQTSNNPIKELADIQITTVVEKNNFRSTSLYSRISQLTIIDIIYVSLISSDKKLAEKYIGDAIEIASKFKL